MNKTGIILLSGGLDSLVSLEIASKTCKVKKALFFNYGQKAFKEEHQAVKEISKHYKIKLEKINLPFLKKITNNALTNKNDNNFNDINSIWIPNRNGLFLNIAGCYCDKYNIDYIIFGANKEEAEHFPDNSEKFIKKSEEFFKFSTIKNPKVIAPCKDMNKIEIINFAIENNLRLDLIKSCYNSKENTNKKHCNKCTSCRLLYNAILDSKKPELIKELF